MDVSTESLDVPTETGIDLNNNDDNEVPAVKAKDPFHDITNTSHTINGSTPLHSTLPCANKRSYPGKSLLAIDQRGSKAIPVMMEDQSFPLNPVIPHSSYPTEEQSSLSVTHSMLGGAVAVEHSSSRFVSTSSSNTQIELHTHRLNMIEANMIQSSRMSLIESRMSQQNQHQAGNFHLDLPSIDEYHAQAMQADELLCHCGLVPVAKAVLAQGPDLGKVFYCCLQKGSGQCSFFKWKGGSPAQVLFPLFKFVTLLFAR